MSDSKIDPLDPLDKASASGSVHQAGSGPAGMNEAQGQPMGMGIGDEDEISLLDLLLVVSENIRLLILWPIAAGLIALGYSTFLMEPVFTAKTSLIPPSQSASGGAAAALASQFGGLASLAGISLPSSGGGDTHGLSAERPYERRHHRALWPYGSIRGEVSGKC